MDPLLIASFLCLNAWGYGSLFEFLCCDKFFGTPKTHTQEKNVIHFYIFSLFFSYALVFELVCATTTNRINKNNQNKLVNQRKNYIHTRPRTQRILIPTESWIRGLCFQTKTKKTLENITKDAPIGRGLCVAHGWRPAVGLQHDDGTAVRFQVGHGNGQARHRHGHRCSGQALTAGAGLAAVYHQQQVRNWRL